MAIYSSDGEVDIHGAEEVNLRNSSGVELLGQQVSAASLPVVIASNQPALLVRSGNTVQQFNGTATTTPATITFASPSYSILIDNGSNGALLVSFNGGTVFKTLNSKSALAIDVTLSSIVVKTNAGSASYEIMVVE